MVTSITQAKPLLTAAELELFDHSRAEPIKSLTAKQLASKEKRTRTLRDKYRDLYRRQTIAQRGKAARATDAAGNANARTKRKGEIMQEMLERFEARSALLESRSQREAEKAPVKESRKTSAKPTRGKSLSSTKKAAPVKSPTTSKKTPPPKKLASTTQAAKAAEAGKAVSATKPTSRAGAKSTATAASARKPKRVEAPLSAVTAVSDGASGEVHVEHLTGLDPAERSHKAPSGRAPAHGGKAKAPQMNAPLDILPSAKRRNPVRSKPGNIAIQGHVSSSVRRAQGKKDSRE